MERITISASLKHADLIRQAINDFRQVGIEALFPNLDSGIAKNEVTLAMMKEIEAAHFEAINKSKALYVICPGGRVGTLVSVEIGFCLAQQKKVYFSEKPEDLGLEALVSSYIPLYSLGVMSL